MNMKRTSDLIKRIKRDPDLTRFQKKVLTACAGIERGDTVTYGELAVSAGSPGAARAVGQALSRNPYLGEVPCHRVVSANGLGGYVLGREVKEKILEEEKRTR